MNVLCKARLVASWLLNLDTQRVSTQLLEKKLQEGEETRQSLRDSCVSR